MKTNIKTTNISLTPAISDYLADKLKSLAKFLSADDLDNSLAVVELGKESQHHRQGDVFRSEINLRANGKDFRAVAHGADLYAVIDEVKDELARLLTSDHKKRRGLLRRGGRFIKKVLRGWRD